MTKKELMQDMWISVLDRFPDPEKHKEILIYHEETHSIRQPLSIVIKDDIKYTKGIMSGKIQRPKNTISAAEFTHWMPIYKPEPKSKRRS